jgi:hypothetical protein
VEAAVTNKRGFYEPNLLSVKDLGDGQEWSGPARWLAIT